MYQVSSNSETKNFLAQKKHQRGLQNFLGPPKKKIYLLVDIKKLME